MRTCAHVPPEVTPGYLCPLDANYGHGGRWGLPGTSAGRLGLLAVSGGRGGCCTSLLYGTVARHRFRSSIPRLGEQLSIPVDRLALRTPRAATAK
jgi:hypothetical protein